MLKMFEYAKLCVSAYKEDLDPEIWFIVDDLVYGLFNMEGRTTVVFRGSDNIENWIRDFDVPPVKNKNGLWVHSGFYDAFYKIWNESLEKKVDKNLPITFIGHSLGGAIAVCALDEFDYYGCNAITFGCPQVFVQGQDYPKMEHYRIVVDYDPVPNLPPLGYQHTIKPYYTIKTNDTQDRIKYHSIDKYYLKYLEKGVI